MKKLIIVCALIGLSSIRGWAVNYQEGTSGAQSLEIGMGVRATGMGGAFCAVADDVNAIFWNPAGLGQLWKIELNPGQYQWLEDINYNFINFVYPLRGVRASNVDDLGAFGTSLIFLDSGKIVGRDINGDLTSDFKAQDRIIVLSYGKKIAENTFFGINGKHIRQELQNEKMETYAFDTGLLFSPYQNGIKFGLNVQNMGQGYKFFKEENNLPLNVKLGVSNTFMDDKLLLAADFNKPKYSNYYTNLGAEWKIDKVFTLRLGYDESNDAGDGLTMGFGISLKEVDIYFMPVAEINIDYAYVAYGDLGLTHRIGLTLKFGTE